MQCFNVLLGKVLRGDDKDDYCWLTTSRIDHSRLVHDRQGTEGCFVESFTWILPRHPLARSIPCVQRILVVGLLRVNSATNRGNDGTQTQRNKTATGQHHLRRSQKIVLRKRHQDTQTVHRLCQTIRMPPQKPLQMQTKSRSREKIFIHHRAPYLKKKTI